MDIRQIMFPVDYSAGSRVALEYAAELAQKLDVPLDVIHVWDRPGFIADEVVIRDASGTEKSLVQMIADNAKAEMEAFVASVKFPAAVRIKHRLLCGQPTSAILEELQKGHHDLVVVGTQGRNGLQHLLLGSFAEKLVRHAPVPVLTVRQAPPSASGRP